MNSQLYYDYICGVPLLEKINCLDYKKILDILKIAVRHNKHQLIIPYLNIKPHFPVSYILILMEECVILGNIDIFTILLTYIVIPLSNDDKMLIYEYLLRLTCPSPIFHSYLIRSCYHLSLKYVSYKPRSVFSLNISYILIK